MGAQKHDAVFIEQVNLIFFEDFETALGKIFQDGLIVDERTKGKNFFAGRILSERGLCRVHRKPHAGTKSHHRRTNHVRRIFFPIRSRSVQLTNHNIRCGLFRKRMVKAEFGLPISPRQIDEST